MGAGDLVFVDNDLGKIIFNVLKKLIDNFCTIVKLPNNNRHKVSEDVDQIWTSKEKKVFFSSRARSQEHITAMEFANLGGKEERIEIKGESECWKWLNFSWNLNGFQLEQSIWISHLRNKLQSQMTLSICCHSSN